MQIQLEKLRFHAHHGVMPQERVTGQDYELDLTLSLRDSVAIQALTADRLESTVNYADVYDVVALFVAGVCGGTHRRSPSASVPPSDGRRSAPHQIGTPHPRI